MLEYLVPVLYLLLIPVLMSMHTLRGTSWLLKYLAPCYLCERPGLRARSVSSGPISCCSVYFLRPILFIWKIKLYRERVTKRERDTERDLLLFHSKWLQQLGWVGAKPGDLSGFATWVAGAQTPGLFYAFPRALAGTRSTNETEATWTVVFVGFRCHK